jgi:hypothetical protein
MVGILVDLLGLSLNSLDRLLLACFVSSLW